MKQEKNFKPFGGWLMLAALLIPIGLVAGGIFVKSAVLVALSIPLLVVILPGFFLINPNGSKVLVLFGKYVGTVKENGFFWANPLLTKKAISLRARNFDSERVKVNDQIGNPILISVILVWRVSDTFKAAFEVDDYESFVRVQSDAAVRKMAGMYPYDNFEAEDNNVTLRSGLVEVNEALEHELDARLQIAGIEIIEARIGYLAYAEEIAQAMLKRQQATAIVAAREKIVEGAVGMVDMALQQLSEKSIIEFDDEKKAAMISNLMVVLCSDKDTNPVINTGTLNH